MATCTPRTIAGISPQLMDEIIAELRLQSDITVTGNNPWEMLIESPFRITLQGRYAMNELVVEVTHRPRIVPCNRIYDQITDLIDDLRDRKTT